VTSVYQEIIRSVPILEVAERYVKLRKVGASYVGYSPFKNETNPSFYVSPSKNIFKCFSSGIGGNVIKLVAEIERISYKEAASKLAKEYNIQYDEYKEDNELNKYVQAYKEATKFYHENLKHNKVFLKYLKERGVFDLIEEFSIGASYKSKSLKDHMLSLGYSLDYLFDIGLLSKNSKGEYIDYFYYHIIIPVRDYNGRIIAFVGRILPQLENKYPKYKNSRATAYFKKSKVIFNMDKAKYEIPKQKSVIITEGIFDAISVYKSYKNVVAFLGVDIHENTIKTLQRHTKTIILASDNDDAGDKFFMNFVEKYHNKLNIYGVRMGEHKDIDEAIRKGYIKDLRQHIETWPEHFIKVANKQINLTNKIEIYQKVYEIINKSYNVVLKDFYLDIVRKALANENIHIDITLGTKDVFLENNKQDLRILCTLMYLIQESIDSLEMLNDLFIDVHMGNDILDNLLSYLLIRKEVPDFSYFGNKYPYMTDAIKFILDKQNMLSMDELVNVVKKYKEKTYEVKLDYAIQ
jgi:DNA primase